MLTISTKAENYLRQLLLKEPKGTHIRIYVVHGGTFKAECGISYCTSQDQNHSDIILQFKFFNVFINKQIKVYLKNSVIDLKNDGLNKQLTLKAPFIKKNVSNNKEFTITDKVKYFIDSVVNPELLRHGGRTSLVNITKDGYVLLMFEGGCNGCAMSQITLKEGIEKRLLKKFPMLQGVRDITDHFHSEHSYY
ncbi:Fe-S biogenesis protein NfuA [Buchnera aphidicola (Hormaphis cornu)]|nr:Fe-S biogenesis protein NfuA [Buchnera aphidicola (Hormaphis cornu)]